MIRESFSSCGDTVDFVKGLGSLLSLLDGVETAVTYREVCVARHKFAALAWRHSVLLGQLLVAVYSNHIMATSFFKSL